MNPFQVVNYMLCRDRTLEAVDNKVGPSAGQNTRNPKADSRSRSCDQSYLSTQVHHLSALDSNQAIDDDPH
eukprot:CAMPEP_0171792620 /NCGR_PEP_ID=MMETSP0991-20121206/67079_1 /TAXON_ID=483369 /ORGANISM="non described non described, Strain CCMP2098" /LENGTH=70 /DNA_ID=CAMNT_0012402747 /DNA_START=609 /DNA_END=821 /DNA_ORIENTATION=-